MASATLLAVMAAAAACAPSSPAATPTSMPKAAIQVTAEPNPIRGRICTGCGDETTTDREAVTTLTIQESGGVGGRVTLIEMTLNDDASGVVIAAGQFDGAGVTFFAQTDRLAGSGSLVAENIGVHYAGSEAGKAATLTYTVHVIDDLGHEIVIELAVPVTT